MCAKKAEKKPLPIDSLKHKDKRKNIPTEELRDFVAADENSAKTMLYPYDPSRKDMDEVVRYVKNHNLGFTIPYSLNGEARNYIPDFIACIDDGHGPDDLLNLLIEVTGENKKDKAAKVSAARTLWVPAVNNHGGFGRWTFIEITDPWDAGNTIRRGDACVAPTEQGTQS
jgi:hypothetical protein